MTNSEYSNITFETNVENISLGVDYDSDYHDVSFENSIYKIPISLIIVLSVFYGLIILVALIGNILVIFVVFVSPRMRTVTNFYIANLAFADVTIAMFNIPFQFHAAVVQRWDLPSFMCKFCPMVGVFSVNSSIFTLVAIALDRYDT